MISRPIHRTRASLGILGAAVALVLAVCAGATPAFAVAPRWRLDSRSAPTNLAPGTKGLIIASASNLGDESVSGRETPITVTDELPPGLKVILPLPAGVGKQTAGEPSQFRTLDCSAEGLNKVSCATKNKVGELTPPVRPYYRLELAIPVEVEPGASGENHVSVTGGRAYECNEVPEGTGKFTSPLCQEAGEEPEEGVGKYEKQLGGPAPGASSSRPIKVNSSPTEFGDEAYELSAENEDGSLDNRAGTHPFQLTTTIALNKTIEEGDTPASAGLVKNLHFALPPGLLGDPNAVPQCSDADFSSIGKANVNACPSNTAIGVAVTELGHPTGVPGHLTETIPVFNLVPAPGEPARFGFEIFKVPVIFDTAVRTDGDYGVTVSVTNATEAGWVLGSQVSFWGEPGDPRHDQSRGWACLQGESVLGERCKPPEERSTKPFLDLPTSCVGGLTTEMLGSSWTGGSLKEEFSLPALGGCEQLPFTPSMTVQPIAEAEGDKAPPTTSANSPTGLRVDVKLPQKETTLAARGLAEADDKDSTVALPEGIQLSPAAANGLTSCSEEEVGFKSQQSTIPDPFAPGAPEPLQFSTAPANCPSASKVGVVHINTPLLPNELEGGVYIAAQEANPFGSLFAVYIVAEDPVSGVRVKLAGRVTPNVETGQLTTTFENTPQTPFEALRLEFFGGPHASISTPPLCGNYTTAASFTAWSGASAAPNSEEPFVISSGPGGSACFATLPLAPGFSAGSSNLQAGGYTSFTVNITRPDTNQALTGLTMHLPSGLAGMLSHVTLCDEADANAGTCPPASLVGHATASAGLGSEPFTQSGQVFITEKYKGAPFGLSIVTPTQAGPFNFGNLVVRSTINIDRTTAALTISNPLPTMINTASHQTGIPAQLKQISVTVDRPEFQFNPTNCTPSKVEATFTGSQGSSTTESTPLQVANCKSLPFKPKFEASTEGRASKTEGASLRVKVTSGFGQANIGKTDLTLPIQLPARLTTIQKACTAAAFEANPATCPEGSNVGTATVHTPVLKNPLTGPAYLVSHGSAKFPDVEFVLQGEGITLILDGATDIKKGITYSRFDAVPDAPVSTFETVLPRSPHSALTSNVAASAKYSLCGANLVMPTTLTGQNGAVVKQNTKIAVTGCPPSVSITNIRVKGNALLVTVKLSQAGTAKITGKGLKTTVKRGLKAGTHTISVPLTKAGRSAKLRHRKIKVQASLTVGRQTATRTATVKA